MENRLINEPLLYTTMIQKVINAIESLEIKSVDISNFDEVKAIVYNQQNKTLKILLDKLNDLVKAIDNQTKMLDQDKVEIINFNDFPKFPEKLSVGNFDELKEYFIKLEQAIIGISIPQPQVNITQPEINIPPPIVTTAPITIPPAIVSPVDLKPLIKELNLSLNKIRTNDKERPLAVRLSNGQEFIDLINGLVNQQKQVMQFLSDVSFIKNSSGATINPATEDTLGTLNSKFSSTALADNMSNPTVPQVGSHVMVWDSTGGNWDRAEGATLFDLDSGAGTQFVMGCSIRLSSSGGSVEGATAINPLQVSLANTVINSTHPVSVEGLVIHDAADSSYGPIRMGGTAKSSIPTAVSATGDRCNCYVDMNGRLAVFLPYLYNRMSTNTTTTIKSGNGFLHCININIAGAAANTATIYDNTAGSGTIIAIIDTTIKMVNIFDVNFTTGLTIVMATGTAADLTISYI